MAEEGREMKFAGFPLSHFEGMTDEEILGIKGIGPKTLEEIRAAQAEAASETEPEPADVVEPKATEAVETEPEVGVAMPQERRCDTCKQPYVPAKLEFKHCPRCHAKWQFEQDAPRVQTKLAGAKTAFGRYNDYGPAETLFGAAKDYYRKGEFEAAAGTLRSASDEVDLVTARGSLDYARQLFAEAKENGVLVAEETVALADQVEAALPKEGKSGKPWQAARDANKLREALRALPSQLREGKARKEREDFLLQLEEGSQSQSQRKRGQWPKKGAR